jgi:excisionase family DNA binding protein
MPNATEQNREKRRYSGRMVNLLLEVVMENYTKKAPVEAQVLDRKELAAYLKISKGKIAQLDIPAVRIGRRVVYRQADVDAWLESRTAGGRQ